MRPPGGRAAPAQDLASRTRAPMAWWRRCSSVSTRSGGTGVGRPVRVERHEVQVADRAQPAVAGQRVLAVHLAAHDHAGAAGPHDAAAHLEDLAHVTGLRKSIGSAEAVTTACARSGSRRWRR
jgi:hypothetical protein